MWYLLVLSIISHAYQIHKTALTGFAPLNGTRGTDDIYFYLFLVISFQTAPVLYTVHAVVTNSDMEFSTNFIDFGFATIHESVIASVKLTNKSILSQKFGFVNLPDVSILA